MRLAPRVARYTFVLSLAILAAGTLAWRWHLAEVGREWINGLRSESKEEGEEEELRPGQPDEAMRWRRLAMQDENGVVDPEGMTRAIAHLRAMRAAQPVGVLGAGVTTGAWTAIGPGNYGGRTRAMVFDPSDGTSNTIFIGSVAGGIWKTTDGGANWARLDDFMANLAVTSLVISQDGQTLYASTGEGFFGSDMLRGAGIFKSIDHGVTWTQLPSTSSAPSPGLTAADFHFVNRLARSPDGNRMLAVGTNGLFLSLDGGGSFTRPAGIPVNIGDGLTDVDFHPTLNTMAVASGYHGQAFYSTDGGANWTAATGLPSAGLPAQPGLSDYRVELAYAPSNPSIVYASVDVALGSLYKSTDGGQSYSLVLNGALLSFQGWYDNVVWVNPYDANVLIVGGVALNLSIDGGLTFRPISAGWDFQSAHADHHVIVAHPGFNNTSNRVVYFGSDGGVYRNADINTAGGACTQVNDVGCAEGWSSLNTNLSITQFYGAAGHPGTGRIVGGTQDNYTLLYDPLRPDPSNNWRLEWPGDGGFSAHDPVDSDVAYGELPGAQIHRMSTTLGYAYITCNAPGQTVKATSLTDGGVGPSAFIAPFILDPNNSNRLLVGTVRLWRTDNAKASAGPTGNCEGGAGPDWLVIKPALGGPTQVITAVAVATGNADIVYVGYVNGKVEKTVNGTGVSPTWTVVDDNSGTNPLPNRMITRITVDPSDPSGQTVYVTVGGYNDDNIWRSLNGGTSWTDIQTGLPAVPVRDLEVNPSNPQWLYAATEVGIFTSDNAGASWSLPHDGPANVSVDELFFMGTKIVAVTHGRGIFTANTDPANDPPTITDIPDQSMFISTSKAFPFTVGDGGDGDLGSLVLTVRSPTGAGVALGGSGASRTVTVTPDVGSLVPQTVAISVSDGTHVATTIFDVTVAAPQAPTIGSIADQSGAVGIPLTVGFTVDDPDGSGEALTMIVNSTFPPVLPLSNITFGGSGANRTITMTPTAAGTTTVLVRPADTEGLQAPIPASFTLTVSAIQPPFISAIGNESTPLGTPVQVPFTIGDPDSLIDLLVLTAASSNAAVLPVGAVSFTGSGQSRSATLTPLAAGTTTVTFTATDPQGHTAQQSFVLTVSLPNVQPPFISPIQNQSTPLGTPLPVFFNIGDADTPIDLLVLSATSSNQAVLPDNGVVFSGSGQGRTATLTPLAAGTTNVSLVVTDHGGLPAQTVFALTVTSGPILQPAVVNRPNVTLQWSAPPGASPSSYTIVASLTPGGGAIASLPVGLQTSTTVPAPDGVFYVRVLATVNGATLASNEIVVVVGAGAVPTAPQNPGATVNGNTFVITRLAPANLSLTTLLTYVIEAGSAPGLKDLADFATGSTMTAFTTPVVPNGSYYIRLRARGGAGTGPASAEIRVIVGPPPPGPPALTGAVGAGRSVSLSWIAPTTGAAVTGYQLQAGTAPGLSNAAVLALPAAPLSFGTSGVPPGTYYVRVVATSASGLGLASNEITLVVP